MILFSITLKRKLYNYSFVNEPIYGKLSIAFCIRYLKLGL